MAAHSSAKCSPKAVHSFTRGAPFQGRFQTFAQRPTANHDAVDPDNRLVASELERRWNEKLERVAHLEQAYAQAEHEGEWVLTPEERRAIQELPEWSMFEHRHCALVMPRKTLQEVRRKRSTSVRLIHNRVSRLFSLAISGLQLARGVDHRLAPVNTENHGISSRLIPRARIRPVYAPIPD
jgi:hypothetical protein